jgi:hypothetical protein
MSRTFSILIAVLALGSAVPLGTTANAADVSSGYSPLVVLSGKVRS